VVLILVVAASTNVHLVAARSLENTEIQSSDGTERDGTITHHKFAFSDVMRATEFRSHLAAQLFEQKNAISTTSFR
jgi:hypothetical protein